jgi:AraC-like DNA-binding protein
MKKSHRKPIIKIPAVTDAERVRLGKAHRYIEIHYAKNPPGPDIAATTGLSLFHFHRRFKHCFGEPPKRIVDRLRISRAKELLLDGMPPAEIASVLSYSNQPHFTAYFRKSTGLPPRQWLEEQKTRGGK